MNCCCSSIDTAANRQFSEKRATNDLAKYRTKGPGSTARLLLAGVAKAGPPHGRLLDVGSGVGALTFELLEQGMTSAVGVDLSWAYIAVAAEEAARRGRSDSTRFVQADFLDVASEVQTADVLVLVSAYRIHGTCGTSGPGFGFRTWDASCVEIRFAHSSIQRR